MFSCGLQIWEYFCSSFWWSIWLSFWSATVWIFNCPPMMYTFWPGPNVKWSKVWGWIIPPKVFYSPNFHSAPLPFPSYCYFPWYYRFHLSSCLFSLSHYMTHEIIFAFLLVDCPGTVPPDRPNYGATCLQAFTATAMGIVMALIFGIDRGVFAFWKHFFELISDRRWADLSQFVKRGGDFGSAELWSPCFKWSKDGTSLFLFLLSPSHHFPSPFTLFL